MLTVLGQATLKNEEADQIVWWAAKQVLLSDSKEIAQSSQDRRGSKRVTTRGSKFFYGLIKVVGLWWAALI